MVGAFIAGPWRAASIPSSRSMRSPRTGSRVTQRPPPSKPWLRPYLDTVRSAQPGGPYLLGGFSHGGLIALEMARRLEARGEAVALLVVLDQPVVNPSLRFLRAAITGIGGLRGLGPAEQSEAFLTWRYRVLRLGELWGQGFGSLIPFGVGKVAGHAKPR